MAGGTGRLGREVVGRLVDRGLPVRVLTRDPTQATDLVQRGVVVLRGNVRDPASLATACAGTSVVVSSVHGFLGTGADSPATVDRDGNANLIEAAAVAGADVVMVSIVGAAPDSPMELFRMKYAAEQHLRARPDLLSTVVRASAFLELWMEMLRASAGRSGRPLVFGRGDNPINFVPVRDVAETVVHAVTDPSTRGSTLEVVGPDDLTFNELAREVQRSAGHPGSARHIPPVALRLMAQTVGRVQPKLGRQARAALAMDHVDLTAAGLTTVLPGAASDR